MEPVTFADVESARQLIAPYIVRTPLLRSDYLSRVVQRDVLVKCENFQSTGSFKIRGATHCILRNLDTAKLKGVVAASAGNHAQGVAAICQRLGIKSTIVMPTMTPTLKVANTRRYGAQVELVGDVYDEARDHALALADKHGYLFVHPFRDPTIMAGQGTVGLELLEDPAFEGVEAVAVPVGGGGLIAGVATVLKAKRPGLKIYGVTAKSAPALWHSFQTGKPEMDPVSFTLAEGVATKGADPEMVTRLKTLVDRMLQISEESIAHAISLIAEHGKMVVEGAGALGLAAVLENLIPEKKIALVLSGGNIDLFALSGVLQRGLVEQGRLVRLDIAVSDRPGGLLAITQLLAQESANIVQVLHQRETLKRPIGETIVEFLIQTRGEDHTQKIISTIQKKGFQVQRGT